VAIGNANRRFIGSRSTACIPATGIILGPKTGTGNREGVEYGIRSPRNLKQRRLLRKLVAKEIPCPGFCPNMIPVAGMQASGAGTMKRRFAFPIATYSIFVLGYGVRGSAQQPPAAASPGAPQQAVLGK